MVPHTSPAGARSRPGSLRVCRRASPSSIPPSSSRLNHRVDPHRAPTICRAATGAVAQLARILGPGRRARSGPISCCIAATEPLRPRGAPLRRPALPRPSRHPARRTSRGLADLLRDRRGDAHTAAWTSAGSTPSRSGSCPSSTRACRWGPTSSPGPSHRRAGGGDGRLRSWPPRRRGLQRSASEPAKPSR